MRIRDPEFFGPWISDPGRKSSDPGRKNSDPGCAFDMENWLPPDMMLSRFELVNVPVRCTPRVTWRAWPPGGTWWCPARTSCSAGTASSGKSASQFHSSRTGSAHSGEVQEILDENLREFQDFGGECLRYVNEFCPAKRYRYEKTPTAIYLFLCLSQTYHTCSLSELRPENEIHSFKPHLYGPWSLCRMQHSGP